MGDAAGNAGDAQLLQDAVDGAPHMQQNRQLELGRELELRLEDPLLAAAVEPGDEMIEPDLADGDEAGIACLARQRRAERRQIGVAGMAGAHRMDAERVGQVVAMGELANSGEVAGIDRRQHDRADAGGARPLDDALAIGLELGGVQMAMGVDPHGCDDACRDRSWPACYRIPACFLPQAARSLHQRRHHETSPALQPFAAPSGAVGRSAAGR